MAEKKNTGFEAKAHELAHAVGDYVKQLNEDGIKSSAIVIIASDIDDKETASSVFLGGSPNLLKSGITASMLHDSDVESVITQATMMFLMKREAGRSSREANDNAEEE